MDAETKAYIDQMFKSLTQAIINGLNANDIEHGRLYARLESIEDLVKDLNPNADRGRLDRLEAEVFGEG